MNTIDSSIPGRIARKIIHQVRSGNLIGKELRTGNLRKNNEKNESAWKYPNGFHMTKINMGTFYMEYLEYRGNGKEKVILQLHGGGYVGALINIYRKFAETFCKLNKGISVLTIDYRVAPENPYPAALEDAISGYKWLLNLGFKNDQIIISGDSAGGGLGLALCMYLRDRNEALPLGIITMSAWTDLTASGKSYETKFEKDPVFGNTKDSLVYNNPYIGDNDPKIPYISPVFGDFTGFPPMLMQVGTYEMLLSDTLTIAAKAKKSNVNVRLSIYKGMFHVFQMSLKLLPESRKAWQEVADFIENL